MMHAVQGEGYRLIRGDCLTVMAGLDGPVDAIIADLPYGTTACEWDAVIPFAPLWAQFKRLIKPNGAIVLFGSQPFTSALVMSNPVWFKYQWVWNKKIAGNPLIAQFQPLKVHEDVLVFSRESHNYRPQMAKGIFRTKGGGYSKLLDVNLTTARNDCYFPKSILEFSNAVRGIHPTQKPVDLLAYLIRTYTNPGETVLDCTMGSGTTIVAAIQEGRKGVGIELDAGYFDISVRRCADASRAARGLPKQLRDDQDYSHMPLFAAGVTE